jgi:molybdopterin converting factor small subunit
LAGVGEEQVELATPGAPGELSVSALLVALTERHAALQGRLQSVRVAVDEEFTEPSALLRGGEVVALIPPVSGG